MRCERTRDRLELNFLIIMLISTIAWTAPTVTVISEQVNAHHMLLQVRFSNYITIGSVSILASVYSEAQP